MLSILFILNGEANNTAAPRSQQRQTDKPKTYTIVIYLKTI
jgi:hypothetical protein